MAPPWKALELMSAMGLGSLFAGLAMESGLEMSKISSAPMTASDVS